MYDVSLISIVIWLSKWWRVVAVVVAVDCSVVYQVCPVARVRKVTLVQLEARGQMVSLGPRVQKASAGLSVLLEFLATKACQVRLDLQEKLDELDFVAKVVNREESDSLDQQDQLDRQVMLEEQEQLEREDSKDLLGHLACKDNEVELEQLAFLATWVLVDHLETWENWALLVRLEQREFQDLSERMVSLVSGEQLDQRERGAVLGLVDLRVRSAMLDLLEILVREAMLESPETQVSSMFTHQRHLFSVSRSVSWY